MGHRSPFLLACGALALLAAPAARAAAAPPSEIDAAAADAAAAAEPAPAEEEAGGGVNLDLGFATHYVFRGLNLFGGDQLDPSTLLAPGVTWSVGDTGLALGWWAAFQLNGAVRDNVDAGVGAEQDLFATYEFGLTDSLALGLQLYGYLYPFADEEIAGTDGAPVWIEPGASVLWSAAVDVGLTVTYMAGVQEANAAYSYLYVAPSVARSFALDDAETLSLDAAASVGFKAWLRADEKWQDNTVDVGVKAALTWYATDAFYLAPSAGLAWTNLAGGGFGDEIIAYGGLNLGVDL